MSKRFSKGRNSPAKRQKLDISRDESSHRGSNPLQNVINNHHNGNDDLWGDDFGDEELEEMDFIASQATQEEAVFVAPKPKTSSNGSTKSSPMDTYPSTSTGIRGSNSGANHLQQTKNLGAQSQIIGSSSIRRGIQVNTQAIAFDDFENDIRRNSHNSTFQSRKSSTLSNVVLVSDDEQVTQWQEEKKKLLEDFMTKEGETEFLRQQLNQIQMRAENAKKEQAHMMEEQGQKLRAEITALSKEKSSLESQLQLQNLKINNLAEKCKLLESGSVKFTQPQTSITRAGRDRSNTSFSGPSKKNETKENAVQVNEIQTSETLKTNVVVYSLRTIPQSAFEPSIPEKSIIEVKIEEKIGKRNLAIIQDEETFRIFENPELTKPKVTIVDGKPLSTEYFMPDLARLMNKSNIEINSSATTPVIGKMVATTRELLLNSTIVLQNISQAMQNDDIRDMNELYLSEFYEMPALHTRNISEARPWYKLERGIETRRAFAALSYIASASDYLSDYVAGHRKLVEPECGNLMSSHLAYYKRGFEFEFLELILDFVSVVGVTRRSHHFTGLLIAIMSLIINVENRVGFSEPGLRRIFSIFKEVVCSRPLLPCFPSVSSILKTFSGHSKFVNRLCISPEKSGINCWKGSLNFTPDACILEIFIAQLDHFKMDPIAVITVTKDLTMFTNIALLNNFIPWLERTKYSCNCCLNLLKFVIIHLCECTKIDVDHVKKNFTSSDTTLPPLLHGVDQKKSGIEWKNELDEDWSGSEKCHRGDFWETLKRSQYCAVIDGIRLLSFLAKKDLDFMIRIIHIEDAFHLFLHNLSKRKDFKLEKSDEIALEIVKQTFVLEKIKEENKSNLHVQSTVDLENEKWTDLIGMEKDYKGLFEYPSDC
ncbi:hypothetical protein QAD02_023770 [Eretmocerus hayati]|uniref:Uncharacterized protein n=1 Tax=Eretmocerus hayati TaxID=131215 RepID=A0ACC2Q1N3_9HYME|nr:hypothetical protein QAD02_023770 [Eretmocerus hayati]